MNGWGLHQWLNVAIIAGIVLMLVTWWLTSRGVLQPRSRMQRVLQFISLMLMLLPAGLEWYFSKSLIMLIAILLCGYGVFQWLKNSSGP